MSLTWTLWKVTLYDWQCCHFTYLTYMFFPLTVHGGCYCAYGFWPLALLFKEVSSFAQSCRASGCFWTCSGQSSMEVWQQANTQHWDDCSLWLGLLAVNVNFPPVCATMQSNSRCCLHTHSWQITQKWSCGKDFKRCDWISFEMLCSFKMH